MKKPSAKPTEHKCPACNCTGFAKVVQPVQPGRKIYPARCEKCGGKGRIAAPTEAALFVVFRRFVATLHELRSCDLVVTAAAAKEHQGHKAASDGKREEGAEAKSDPAVFGHGNLIAGGPYRDRPNNREDKYCCERPEQNEVAAA
jgi:transcription elongation factor Elf1